MKFLQSSVTHKAIIILLLFPILAGCSSKKSSANPQLDAITVIRTTLELPQLPLAFVETTNMANSTTGGLVVNIYQDADGRKYSVDPQTDQVVEIDARAMLSNLPPKQYSTAELEAKALKYFQATIPDFESRKSSWHYEEGEKGIVIFFSWYADMVPGTMNRPFAQIGMDLNGALFAYYNTLSLK
jgi:hypothetical protein